MTLTPERKTIIKGKLIEEFYWNGKLVVYINDRAFNGTYEEATKEEKKKKCTWKNCNNIAKHQQKGSLINLCDKHNKELNNEFKNLIK